jgi:hypothetical protein
LSETIKWVPVCNEKPCPICERVDWCSVSADGALVICMRVRDGAIKPTRNGGWLHRVGPDDWQAVRPRQLSVRLQKPVPTAEMSALAERFQRAIDPGRLDGLADKLRLSTENLYRHGIGWFERWRAWSAPMRDAAGNVIGIHLRPEIGKKRCVTGSHLGLFIPSFLDATGMLMVAEGLTDAVALLDLGFEAIGRPSCSAGGDLVAELVRANRPQAIVVVGDRDPERQGQQGAEALASMLALYCGSVRWILPPEGVKDVRLWKARGATRETIEAAAQAAPMMRLGIRLRAFRPRRMKGVTHGR